MTAMRSVVHFILSLDSWCLVCFGPIILRVFVRRSPGDGKNKCKIQEADKSRPETKMPIMIYKDSFIYSRKVRFLSYLYNCVMRCSGVLYQGEEGRQVKRSSSRTKKAAPKSSTSMMKAPCRWSRFSTPLMRSLTCTKNILLITTRTWVW